MGIIPSPSTESLQEKTTLKEAVELAIEWDYPCLEEGLTPEERTAELASIIRKQARQYQDDDDRRLFENIAQELGYRTPADLASDLGYEVSR